MSVPRDPWQDLRGGSEEWSRGHVTRPPRTPSATTSGSVAIVLASAASSCCSCRGCTCLCPPGGIRPGSHPSSADNGERQSCADPSGCGGGRIASVRPFRKLATAVPRTALNITEWPERACFCTGRWNFGVGLLPVMVGRNLRGRAPCVGEGGAHHAEAKPRAITGVNIPALLWRSTRAAGQDSTRRAPRPPPQPPGQNGGRALTYGQKLIRALLVAPDRHSPAGPWVAPCCPSFAARLPTRCGPPGSPKPRWPPHGSPPPGTVGPGARSGQRPARLQHRPSRVRPGFGNDLQDDNRIAVTSRRRAG